MRKVRSMAVWLLNDAMIPFFDSIHIRVATSFQSATISRHCSFGDQARIAIPIPIFFHDAFSAARAFDLLVMLCTVGPDDWNSSMQSQSFSNLAR